MRSAAIAFLAAAALVSRAVDPSTVKLDSGVIEGNVLSSSRAFLGIPFAAAPVGSLRWQPPQAVESWSGVRPAKEYGNACYQPSNSATSGVQISEDCLYLNVYTPYPIPAKPVPIMIFIYGGSWNEGAASFPVYNAESDISLVEDVVVVTVNYRLNVFGFLASGALRSQDPDGSTGNYGLQDQRFAMEWVQRNGAAFGGDISRVTIFGESAGAGSVSNHLLQPKAWPYFHRAISESGPVAAWTAQTYEMASAKYRALASMVGCCESESNCNDNSTSVLACLQHFNASTLEAAAQQIPGGLVVWTPVIDGVEVLDSPLKLLSEGKIANVPFMLGTNKDEGTLFNSCPKTLPASEYDLFLNITYGASLAPLIAQQYPIADFSSSYWASSRVLGDCLMSCFALSTAQAVLNARANTANAAPVFLYLFNHTLEYTAENMPYWGCYHSSELYLVFDFESELLTSAEQDLAHAFVQYWTSFAATGVPSGSGLPVWPAFTAGNAVTAVLDVNVTLTPVTGVKAAVCSFWAANPAPDRIVWGQWAA